LIPKEQKKKFLIILFSKNQQWIKEHELPGAAVFVGVYIISTVAFIPGSVLTLGAGFVFSYFSMVSFLLLILKRE
jgi:uncharacterized membrane protein YdjX (TVP38/TMEM64 family)